MKERVRWEGLLLIIFALFLFSGDKAWGADSTTLFPDFAQGDTVVTKDGAWNFWYSAGDYAQGQRTLIQATTIRSVSYHMVVALNLILDETANLSMFLNGTNIGQFQLRGIDTIKDVTIILDTPITASQFTIKLLLTNTLTEGAFWLSPDAPGTLTLSSSINAGTIAGTVTEGGAANAAPGDPIDGATVTATNANGDQKTTLTEADGSYMLENLTPGNWIVQASMEGYRKGIPTPAEVVDGETTTLNLTLPAPVLPGSIFGTVTEGGAAAKAAGDPISNATVTATNVINGEKGSAVTDENGAYEIADLSPGVWTVMATKAGYKSNTPMPTGVTPGQDTTRNLTMKPLPITTGSISGTVTNANSTGPLDGATVTAKNLQTGDTVETTTEADGTYEFPDIAKGLYMVRATMTGYKGSTPQVASVTPGGEVTLDFGLTPKPAVKARGRK